MYFNVNVINVIGQISTYRNIRKIKFNIAKYTSNDVISSDKNCEQ